MLLPSDAFASVLLPDEYRYSPWILCGPPAPLVDYYPNDITWFLPCIHGEKHPPSPSIIWDVLDNTLAFLGRDYT